MWRVFEQCSKADYEEMGVRTFEHFIRRESMEESMDSGEMVFFGAYESNRLVGVVAMRSGFHVSLLFVEKAYQRRGVAWGVLRRGGADFVGEEV